MTLDDYPTFHGIKIAIENGGDGSGGLAGVAFVIVNLPPEYVEAIHAVRVSRRNELAVWIEQAKAEALPDLANVCRRWWAWGPPHDPDKAPLVIVKPTVEECAKSFAKVTPPPRPMLQPAGDDDA